MLKKTKLSSPKALRFEGSRLYLRDILQIADEAARRQIEIRFGDDEYEYESVEEVRTEKGDNIRSVNIWFKDTANHSTLRIELSLGTWEIWPGQSDQLAGLERTLVNLLMERRPWYARFPGLSPTFAIAFATIFFSDQFNHSWPTVSAAARLFGLIFLLVGMTCNLARVFSGSIILKREHEVISWYEKHGAKLLYGLIGAALSQAGKQIFDFLASR